MAKSHTSGGVPVVFRAVPDCSVLFRMCSVLFRMCLGLFRRCLGLFRTCSGLFRRCSGLLRCSRLAFRVLVTCRWAHISRTICNRSMHIGVFYIFAKTLYSVLHDYSVRLPTLLFKSTTESINHSFSQVKLHTQKYKHFRNQITSTITSI
jgi:hypothetical protein